MSSALRSVLALLAVSTSSVALAEPDAAIQPVASVVATLAPRTQAQVRENVQAMFAALRQSNWTEAKNRALSLDKGDPLRAVALSQLYLAKGSPRVELFDLLDLVNTATWLPDADQLVRLAQKRGAQILPSLPQTEKLVWLGGAPRREYVPTTKLDAAAQALVAQMLPYIKADNPAGAEALIAGAELTLTPEGLAEVRQRAAWSYYIENDDANARRLATRVLETGTSGDWTTQAHWTLGLAAWRENDPLAAATAFSRVATLAGNDDMRAAGAYWAARAYMNAGDPARVEPLLRLATQKDETFYGLLARETLGITTKTPAMTRNEKAWKLVKDTPAARAAIALHDLGEDDLADKLVRRQAQLGGAAHYDGVLLLAAHLGLPQTQLWLSHNGPAGRKPDSFARFPVPQWTPDGGWRVDPALVFAHALQESGFRPTVVSPAGARGIMQVMPGTARDMAGMPITGQQLDTPSTNMEYGQRYLETLRDMSATGGLLPKVMAAYNAGPLPVERWNSQVKDKGDPLLFIESLPYYETRAYVNIVMRNYWMYQIQGTGRAEALTTMAQGGWPRFPTAKAGKTNVRLSYRDPASDAN
ncbi:soluble lytic murein transglycosylase-like protein [Sphingobium subterraneum]|uniref:Soluble lytic murein transglycosylase-like protein n=1 Tax=Sphingobium subterraneum TaxID=627688 RepID=A0A841IYH2_9SPHN|nr:soluble lytic murein transglycosylase-like protein [Sphingobium subterraneum]